MEEQDRMHMGMVYVKKVAVTQWMRGRAQGGKVREVIRGQAMEGMGETPSLT